MQFKLSARLAFGLAGLALLAGGLSTAAGTTSESSVEAGGCYMGQPGGTICQYGQGLAGALSSGGGVTGAVGPGQATKKLAP